MKGIILKKLLPEGMVFPFDFGLIPDTKGGDGDPLDVKSDVKRVFIEGREVPMKSRQTELRDRYSGR